MNTLKSYILNHEPFKPAHMGHWIRTRYFKRYVRPLLQARAVERVLDAGCGTGTYTRMLAAWLPKSSIRAVDILPIKDWQNPPSNVSFETLDLRMLDESEKYDLVVSVDVLEHIPDNVDVIRRLIRALRQDGYLYIAVPSETEERHFFPLEWFGRFHEWEKDEHIGEQHTLEQLKSIVGSEGMNIKVARHTFTFFGHLAWEIEILLHWHVGVGQRLRVLFMPILKLLGVLDVVLPIGSGNNLILAQKKR